MIKEPSDELKQALKEIDDPNGCTKEYNSFDELINDVMKDNKNN